MDIDIYHNFLVVVANGTISGAARQLNMTQPALSMQMKTLQNIMGQELISKSQGSHRLELTPAGEIVYNKALKICQLEDKLQRELEEKKEGLRGTLQIPIFHWEDEWLVKKVIPAFYAQYPLVKFSLKWMNPQTMQASNHQVDCRVLLKSELADYRESYDVMFSGEVKLFAVKRKDSSWFPSNITKLNFRKLDGIPLAMHDNPNGKRLVNQMYHYGLEPNVLVWTNYRKGALKAVESGMCMAVVFADADKADYVDLEFVPLEDEELLYNYVISKPKGIKLTSLLQRFIDFAIEQRQNFDGNKN